MTRPLLPLLCVLLPATALAQVDELENPGTVLAVQDRTYRLNSELVLGIGILPLDAFYKGLTVSVAYAYHFSDAFAWQIGRGLYSYNVKTGLRDQLQRDFGVLPTAFPQVNWIVGSDLVWTPLYGKLAWLNRSVSHYEIFGSVGGSVVNLRVANDITVPTTSNVFRPAAHLGLGIRYFLNKSVSFRLDASDDYVIASDSNQRQNVLLIQLGLALTFGGTE